MADMFEQIIEKNRAATAARDKDDLDTFLALTDEIGSTINPETGRPYQYIPPTGFRQMYEGSQRILVLHEKHDDRYFGLGGPDRFASLMLQIVEERLNEGWYAEHELAPSEPSALAAFYLERFEFSCGYPHKAPREKLDLWAADHGNWSCLDEIDDVQILYWINREYERGEHETVEFLMAYLFKKGSQSAKRALRKIDPVTKTMEAIIKAIPVPANEEASRIIGIGKTPSDFRRAGRLAYTFLLGRKDHQYERMTIQTVE